MLLTIDIGTSSFKSAIWDLNGNRLSFAAVPLSAGTADNINETDPAQWLRAFEACCQKLLLNMQAGNFSAVQAVVISGNGPTLVPVTGEPRSGICGFSVAAENVRLWLDRRAEKYHAEVSALMGGYVDAAFFLPKVLAIKNEEKELYQKTKIFLGCPEYLAYTLTGEARSVFPSEGFDRWFWNDSVLEKLNLDAEKFPAFIRPGDCFGTLAPSAAEYFGFAKNVPVISGGPDFFAAILGAGITEPGQVCDRTGSSEGINLCTLNRIDCGHLMSYGHPLGNLSGADKDKHYWNLSGVIPASGKAIEWCLNLFELSGFEDFFALAQKSKSGSGGLIFLPYLAGERLPLKDSFAQGQWSGISLGAGRAEFANSVLEGICFAIRNIINTMEEAGGKSPCGAKVKELRVTGGLAGTGFLNQLKADITGKKVLSPVHKEAELLGLAIIGACSLGIYSSRIEAASSLARIGETYKPDLEKTAFYNEMFDAFRRC